MVRGAAVSAFLVVGCEMRGGDGDCDNAQFDDDKSVLLLLRHHHSLSRHFKHRAERDHALKLTFTSLAPRMLLSSFHSLSLR
jgi:hypothetical protein